MLAEVADFVTSFEARAQRGRDSPGARALLDLVEPSSADQRDYDRQSALDDRLWAILDRLKTPYLTRTQGGHGHTHEEVACLLGAYLRLDIAAARESRRVVSTVLGVLEDGSMPAAELRRETLLRFEPDLADWGSVRQTMAAALGVSPQTVDNKWVRIAPVVLAAELVRDEALALHAHSKRLEISRALTESARTLEHHGLLPWLAYVPLDSQVATLRNALEMPLAGYADAGKDFEVVIAQLETTNHSMHGLAPADDEDPLASESSRGDRENMFRRYWTEQVAALDRGVDIKRIFLYRDNQPSEREKLQKEALDQLREAEGRKGEYRAWIARRQRAADFLEELSNSSLVILDYGMTTQRVVKMITPGEDPTEHYFEIAANPAGVDRALRAFDAIRRNCASEIKVT